MSTASAPDPCATTPGFYPALLRGEAQPTPVVSVSALAFMTQTSPPATWAPGAIVPGTVYRVIRPLGSGGMGDVYEAEHELLGIRRALKVLNRRLASREDLGERLRIEARALASLRHPNLVEVHDLGVASDGRLFFAMELLVGATLRDVLARRGALPVPVAVGIAAQVLDALGAAHERGMIHRDVKPENVFVQQKGPVKLLDFGVAKAVQGGASVQALTAAGMAVGTPRYMAPEQAEGHTVDARADLYTVGVLLWEMLAGRAPFADMDPIAAAVAAVTKGVPPLEDTGVTGVPEQLLEVLRRATQRDREARFSTASAFAAELREFRSRSLPPPAPGEGEGTTGGDRTAEVSMAELLGGVAPEGDPTDVDGLATLMSKDPTMSIPSSRTDAGGTLRMDLAAPPLDPRNLATPTSIPAARAGSSPGRQGGPSVPANRTPSPPAPTRGLLVAVPLAIALSVLGTWWVLRRPEPPVPASAAASAAATPSDVRPAAASPGSGATTEPPPGPASVAPTHAEPRDPGASASARTAAPARSASREPTRPVAPRTLPGSGL